MYAGRFSYLANNFHVTASAVGSSFSPGSPEVRGKINFPNTFANIMFANVYTALELEYIVLVKKEVGTFFDIRILKPDYSIL